MSERITGVARNVQAIIAAIKTVCADDGWAVDLDTANRIHVHKDGYHFDIDAGASTNTMNLYACTGYSSGNAAANQPGASGAAECYFIATSSVDTRYEITVTGHNLYAFLDVQSATQGGFCWGVITDKIGTWTGGQFVQGKPGSASVGIFSSANTNTRLSINGEWAPNATYGALVGMQDVCSLRGEMPFHYSAGILRMPVPIFVRDVSNASLLHPAGYAPNIYMMRGGDVYMNGDTITFEGEQYRCVVERPGVSTSTTFMLKME